MCVTTFGVTIEMKLEWDRAKNRANVRKHGLDFVDAVELFRSLLVVEPDLREDYGEQRWIGMGAIRARCLYRTRLQTVRIISLRKATSRERKKYEKAIQNRLEAS